MKVYIDKNVHVIRKDIFSEHEIVDNYQDADICVYQSTIEPIVLGKKIDLSKVIYISLEPPIAGHRLFCYEHQKDFLLYIGWDDEDSGNLMKLTNEPQYFPWQIIPWRYKPKQNNNAINRGVFMMNMVNAYEDVPDSYGAINITKTRRLFGEYAHDNIKDSVIMGLGWPWHNKRTTYSDNWQIDKQIQIEKSGCAFVVAMENVIMKNHITEKIKDGLISDRVTLYLGCPNIEEFIPTNCFVDLRKWFNPLTKEVDMVSLHEYLNNMTPEEYNLIILNAREFIKGNCNYHRNLEKLENKIKGYLHEHENNWIKYKEHINI